MDYDILNHPYPTMTNKFLKNLFNMSIRIHTKAYEENYSLLEYIEAFEFIKQAKPIPINIIKRLDNCSTLINGVPMENDENNTIKLQWNKSNW